VLLLVTYDAVENHTVRGFRVLSKIMPAVAETAAGTRRTIIAHPGASSKRCRALRVAEAIGPTHPVQVQVVQR
jgi:hypothetical protein